MIDNSWVMDIEDKIYTIIKAKSENKIKEKFPDVYFTMTDATLTKPKFPTIYIKFLNSSEEGTDLEGTDINAILSAIQIEITVSQAQDMQGARFIQGVILNTMKSLHYQSDRLGGFETSTTDTRTIISRFERIIGFEENL